MPDTIDHETRARTRKAIALADALRKVGCDAGAAERLDDEGWSHAAAIAGVRLPSATTKEVVVEILAATVHPDDPFEGLA